MTFQNSVTVAAKKSAEDVKEISEYAAHAPETTEVIAEFAAHSAEIETGAEDFAVISESVEQSDVEASDLGKSELETAELEESELETSELAKDFAVNSENVEQSDLEASDLGKSELETAELEESELETSELAKSEREESEREGSELEGSELEESELEESQESASVVAPSPLVFPYEVEFDFSAPVQVVGTAAELRGRFRHFHSETVSLTPGVRGELNLGLVLFDASGKTRVFEDRLTATPSTIEPETWAAVSASIPAHIIDFEIEHQIVIDVLKEGEYWFAGDSEAAPRFQLSFVDKQRSKRKDLHPTAVSDRSPAPARAPVVDRPTARPAVAPSVRTSRATSDPQLAFDVSAPKRARIKATVASEASNSRPVSVIISTLNRVDHLSNAIASLRYQTYDNFEVIVVNGPSVDGTEEFLATLGDDIIVGRVDDANLSKSRNRGICLSSGEILLFLDDDAYAEPEWIANIVQCYDDPRVGAAGTRVYDHTGFRWQMNPFLIDQFYRPDFNRRPPLWAFEFKDSKTIPHILGASSSFRRDIVTAIGGFDEEIAYFLDESELCRRVVDAGFKIRFVDSGASVHHKFAPGVTRDQRRVLTHPYQVAKSKYYVTLSDCKRYGNAPAVYLAECDKWVQELKSDAKWHYANRGLSRSEYQRYLEDVDRGVRDGCSAAVSQARKSIVVPPARPEALIRFPRLAPEGGRRTICFISRFTPRRSPGGVARYIWDLATGFAERGHEVHLITLTDKDEVVEYEDGLWVRNLSETSVKSTPVPTVIPDLVQGMTSGPAMMNIRWSRAAYMEVQRLRRDRYVDFVVAPAWDQEGLYCVLDSGLKTIVSMNTTFRRFSEIEEANIPENTLTDLTSIENVYLGFARLFHANSTSSYRHLQSGFGVVDRGNIITAPHGVHDVAAAAVARAQTYREQNEGPVKVLYVSRLEKRKGTDLFLEAARQLLAKGKDVEFVVVGRDSYGDNPTLSYRTRFERENSELLDRVSFLGELKDRELAGLYESCDIFCVPSRYESFGIIYIEAMRYGMPVVAMDTGGVPDIVVDGETGYLCKTETAKAVEGALERLIDDKEERLQFGADGRSRYLQLFEHDVVVDRTLNAFLKLIETH